MGPAAHKVRGAIVARRGTREREIKAQVQFWAMAFLILLSVFSRINKLYSRYPIVARAWPGGPRARAKVSCMRVLTS